jgi:hypothetical protein
MRLKGCSLDPATSVTYIARGRVVVTAAPHPAGHPNRAP